MTGFPKNRHVWTAAEEEMVKTQYPTITTKELAKELGVTTSSLHNKAETLQVNKIPLGPECTKCGVELTSENRYPHSHRCRACFAKYFYSYKKTHWAHLYALAKKRVKAHPEKRRAYYFSHRERINDWQHKYRQLLPYMYWSQNAFSYHKRSGFVMQLSAKELASMARETQVCCVCGVVLDWLSQTCGGLANPTLDRIANGQIISRETAQIICRKCNIAKNDRPMDDFIAYCQMVATKFAKLLEEP